MRNTILLLCTLLLTAIASVNAQDAADSYRLGPGDTIEIRVFGEADLSMAVLVGDSGRFNYPLLGEVQVSGMTAKEVENQLDKGLRGDYLINPAVTVSVAQYRPFYVNGEVEDPGAYPYQPGLTLQKAIALAGGFTERAAKTSISVASDGRDTVARAELTSIIRPGDVITVDQSFF